jgi:hypothetical protein
MKTEKKGRKLLISKKTVLHLSGQRNTDYWIKTSGGIMCPTSSGTPICFNAD